MKKQDCEQLTLFPEDFPVSRFLAPGSEEAQGMTVTSGLKCSGLLRNSGPLGLLAKTLLASSAWQSQRVTLTWKADQLTGWRVRTTITEYYHSANECCSMVSSKTSVTSVTKFNHLLFRLVPSTPRIEETGLQSWATPNTMDYLPQRSPEALYRQATISRKGRTRPANLREQVSSQTVELWSTPKARDFRSATGDENRNSLDLNVMVKLWPTPKASDADMGMTARTSGRPIDKSTHLQTQVYLEERLFPTPKATIRGGDCPSERERNSPDLAAAVNMWSTPRANDAEKRGQISNDSRNGLPAMVLYATPCAGDAQGTSEGGNGRSLCTDVAGQLNPDWVEWLMGFPIGWTDFTKDNTSHGYIAGWWDTEPDMPRVATNMKGRADRLRCLGNAVVPQQFYPIFQAIYTIMTHEGKMKK